MSYFGISSFEKMNSLFKPNETQLAAGFSPWAIDLQILPVTRLPVRPGEGLGIGQSLGSEVTGCTARSFPRSSPSSHSLSPSDSSLDAVVGGLLFINFTRVYILDALKMCLKVPL